MKDAGRSQRCTWDFVGGGKISQQVAVARDCERTIKVSGSNEFIEIVVEPDDATQRCTSVHIPMHVIVDLMQRSTKGKKQ